jgi:pimeloyl-ACP methyl ester carboxylesterase
MTGNIKFKDASLFYRDEGKGNAIVLLHGYLESSEIWGGFGEELSKHFRVISLDLPGHGKSSPVCESQTIEIMADSVKAVLEHLEIGRAVIVGHSMGGYVTLAFAEIFPEKTLAYCLFHSHALADSDEKKLNREREIDLVKSGKKTLIINTNIPRTFANDNIDRLANEVKRAIEIGLNTKDEGIICALHGMKSRPDRQRVLRESSMPVMIIAGRKDNVIPFGLYEQHFSLADQTEVLILENSGHMGFIEETQKSLEGIRKFVNKVYS